MTALRMVFAMSRHKLNAGVPCIFRSYQGVANQMPNCTIWEALCASMAHPELFKSIEIGDAPMQESFVDGALGCNNAIRHVLAEAKALFPGGHPSSVLSIGAGHARTIQVPGPSPFQRFLPTNVLAVMKEIATHSGRVAQEMAERFQGTTNVYFRFNIDQGLQNVKLSDWEQLSEVSAHARAYMRKAEPSERLDRAVKAIKD
jgi:predicted acylesterase/phospholipase RssA